MEARRKTFETATQLYRHLATGGLSHIAVEALDLAFLFDFILAIMEIADTHGTSVAQGYALVRLHQLKESIDLQANPSATGLPDISAAKDYTGTFLRATDEHLLASLVRDRLPAPAKDHARVPPPGQTAPPRTGAPSQSDQICFDHNPAANKACTRTGCSRKHLDTNDTVQKGRWESAKATFDQNHQRRTRQRTSGARGE